VTRRRRGRWAWLFVPVLTLGCAMLREGNPVTTPGSAFGPCGSWVDCGANQPKADRCCPPAMDCAVDDGGPYCAADENYDPSDPVTWGVHPRDRQPRAAHGPS
jgi:hypothetical protein